MVQKKYTVTIEYYQHKHSGTTVVEDVKVQANSKGQASSKAQALLRSTSTVHTVVNTAVKLEDK